MRKNKLFICLLFVLCFTCVGNVKAANDKGFAICDYTFDMNVDGETISQHVRFGVANSANNSYCSVKGLSCKQSNEIKYTGLPLYAFHKKGTSKYNCPQLKFVLYNKAEKERKDENCQSGNSGNTSANCPPIRYTSYTFKPIESSQYEKIKGNDSYKNKQVSSSTLHENLRYSGASYTNEDCGWIVSAIISDPQKAMELSKKPDDAAENITFNKCNNTKNADLVEKVKKYANDEDYTQKSYSEISCSNIFGEKLLPQIKTGFLVICVIGIVILVFTMSGDFIKSIASGDADNMAETFKKAKTRIIATVILLLLPIFVNFVIDFINSNVTIVEYKDEKGENVNSGLKVHIGNLSDCGVVKKGD